MQTSARGYFPAIKLTSAEGAEVAELSIETVQGMIERLDALTEEAAQNGEDHLTLKLERGDQTVLTMAWGSLEAARKFRLQLEVGMLRAYAQGLLAANAALVNAIKSDARAALRGDSHPLSEVVEIVERDEGGLVKRLRKTYSW